MMDFGFGAFLEKFESYFGKGPTKALLILIGLAVTAATGSLIWHTALEPIVKAIVGDIPLRPRNGFLNAFWLASVIGAGLAIGFAITTGIGYIILGSSYRRAVFRVEQKQDKIEDTLQRAEDVSRKAREAFTANILLFEEIVKTAVDRGIFTRDIADEFVSLLEDETETRP